MESFDGLDIMSGVIIEKEVGMKRTRNIYKTAFLVLSIILLSSCGNGEINPERAGDGQKKESTVDLSQFAEEDGKVWSESWSEKTADGTSVGTGVSAYISIPKLERMSTVEVRRYVFSQDEKRDQENKKKMAEGIFEDGICYYDMERLPKSEIQKRLAEAREYLERDEESLKWAREHATDKDQRKEDITDAEMDLEHSMKKVKEYENLLKKAPDDFVKNEKGDYKGNSYLGQMNGTDYVLTFEKYEDESSAKTPRDQCSISFYANNMDDIAPDELKGREGQIIVEETGEAANRCVMKKEDAKKQAEEFLQKTGFSGLVNTKEEVLRWSMEGDDDPATEDERIDGWSFTFAPGVDGVAFSSFLDETMAGYQVGPEIHYFAQYGLNCQISVYITDKGVIRAEWENPVEILSVTPGVKLLPLDEIKKIIRDGMGDYVAFRYGRGVKAVRFNRMDLVYYRVCDPENGDMFTYIPAWRLMESDGSETQYAVNAMDGSIIKDWDTTWKIHIDESFEFPEVKTES